MSDSETSKAGKGPVTGWTDREILAFLFGAIKHHNLQINYNEVPIPAGRNANGIRQKINKMLIAYKPDIEAMKAGEPLPKNEVTPKNTPRKTPVSRKRKNKDENTGDADGSPKKRGRPKKNTKPELDQNDEDKVQDKTQEQEV